MAILLPSHILRAYIARSLLLDSAFSLHHHLLNHYQLTNDVNNFLSLKTNTTIMKSIFVSAALVAAADALIARDSTW
jgi:hypothetical protein